MTNCKNCLFPLLFGARSHLACFESKEDRLEYKVHLLKFTSILMAVAPYYIDDYVGLSLCSLGIQCEKLQSEQEIRGKEYKVFDREKINSILKSELARVQLQE